MFVVAILALCSPPRAGAETTTVRIITEEFPPYNYTEAGQITGFSTAVVRAVLAEIGVRGEFQSMPWARAYETAQNSEGVLIYSIGRNPQRESLFKWVGVIAPVQYHLYSLRERDLKLNHLDDARHYQIATVNEDIGEQYLLSKGFLKGKNLQSSTRYEINYEKLKLGRVDLWIMSELVAAYLSRQAGDDPAKVLAPSYAINDMSDSSYYMAFGAKTAEPLVERFRQGLQAIKRNGTYDALKKQWF
jgi:polar amino acid transport system substrate-binding protein